VTTQRELTKVPALIDRKYAGPQRQSGILTGIQSSCILRMKRAVILLGNQNLFFCASSATGEVCQQPRK
jgi:hypothetical protein